MNFTDKEILDYAIAEEGLLIAQEYDYLSIARIVLQQVNESLAKHDRKVIAEFREYLLKNSTDLPDDFKKVLYENLWDLYES